MKKLRMPIIWLTIVAASVPGIGQTPSLADLEPATKGHRSTQNVPANEALQQLIAGDRNRFRRALLKAAREDRGLTRTQKRRLFLFAYGSPRGMLQLQQAVLAVAIEEGQIADNQLLENVDWDALLEFIKELLPLIMELITFITGLFADIDLPPTTPDMIGDLPEPQLAA